MMILTCKIEGCFNATENPDIGLCATHAREARKKAAPKEKPRKTRISKTADPEREAIYHAIKDIWIQQPENYFCDVCKTANTTEPHHKEGRLGDLLFDVRKWLPVCRHCHENIERNPEIAYRNGWSLLRNSNEPHTI